ncbi:MAG: Gfo/Idh/MocA family protein, partial [Planctomycetota bacterium]
MKKRFVQVGLGGRSEMFWKALATDFRSSSELVGISDMNAGRLALRTGQLKELGVEVKAYAAEDFETMIAECKPDTVIVTTKDCHHHEYITRAMELGCDAITEKPMTTDVEKCQAILEAEKRTGKTCTVTFNYRYAPPRSQLKDMLMSGLIGDIVSVDFHWMLNTSHGADYFRRWHRNKVNSGGLMVHKAT